jgi:type I restriction-modification system DNA methylase subunit
LFETYSGEPSLWTGSNTNLQGITQSYIFGFDVENKISRSNFVQHDITPEAKRKAKEKLQELFNLKENMKFDAVVGNPPYQEKESKNA